MYLQRRPRPKIKFVTVEYTSGNERVKKTFNDSAVAKRFYNQKLKADCDPRVVKAELF